MTFSVINAPETFQCTMDVTRSPVKWQYSLVYPGNNVVFFRSPCNHFAQVLRLLNLSRNEGVIVKLKKCRLFANTIDCLCHVIQPRCLEIAFHTTDVMKGLKSLNQKIQKHQLMVFGAMIAEETAAIKELQKRSLSPPALTFLFADGCFTLDLDSCNSQVGCALLQD